MGFFSWDTADTNESIMNECSNSGAETVYMLNPNGKNIREDSYEGYGEFGGVDAYEFLALNNIDAAILKRAKDLNIELRMLGIYLDYKYYIDARTNKKYCYVFSDLFTDLNGFKNYGVEVGGVEINTLIKNKVWVEMPLSDYLGEIKTPLKFSYDDIDYHSVGASKTADNQGFFEEEEY